VEAAGEGEGESRWGIGHRGGTCPLANHRVAALLDPADQLRQCILGLLCATMVSETNGGLF
jgi:hypothetical protein